MKNHRMFRILSTISFVVLMLSGYAHALLPKMRIMFLGVDVPYNETYESTFDQMLRRHFNLKPDWICANKFEVEKVFGRGIVASRYLNMQEAQKIYEKEKHRMIVGCRVNRIKIKPARYFYILPFSYTEYEMSVSLEVLDAKEAVVRYAGENMLFTSRKYFGYTGFGDPEDRHVLTAEKRRIMIEDMFRDISDGLFDKIDGAISGLVVKGSGKIEQRSNHFIPKGFEESIQFEESSEEE